MKFNMPLLGAYAVILVSSLYDVSSANDHGRSVGESNVEHPYHYPRPIYKTDQPLIPSPLEVRYTLDTSTEGLRHEIDPREFEDQRVGHDDLSSGHGVQDSKTDIIGEHFIRISNPETTINFPFPNQEKTEERAGGGNKIIFNSNSVIPESRMNFHSQIQVGYESESKRSHQEPQSSISEDSSPTQDENYTDAPSSGQEQDRIPNIYSSNHYFQQIHSYTNLNNTSTELQNGGYNENQVTKGFSAEERGINQEKNGLNQLHANKERLPIFSHHFLRTDSQDERKEVGRGRIIESSKKSKNIPPTRSPDDTNLEGLESHVVDESLLERVQQIIEDHERQQKEFLRHYQSNGQNGKTQLPVKPIQNGNTNFLLPKSRLSSLPEKKFKGIQDSPISLMTSTPPPLPPTTTFPSIPQQIQFTGNERKLFQSLPSSKYFQGHSNLEFQPAILTGQFFETVTEKYTTEVPELVIKQKQPGIYITGNLGVQPQGTITKYEPLQKTEIQTVTSKFSLPVQNFQLPSSWATTPRSKQPVISPLSQGLMGKVFENLKFPQFSEIASNQGQGFIKNEPIATLHTSNVLEDNTGGIPKKPLSEYLPPSPLSWSAMSDAVNLKRVNANPPVVTRTIVIHEKPTIDPTYTGNRAIINEADFEKANKPTEFHLPPANKVLSSPNFVMDSSQLQFHQPQTQFHSSDFTGVKVKVDTRIPLKGNGLLSGLDEKDEIPKSGGDRLDLHYTQPPRSIYGLPIAPPIGSTDEPIPTSQSDNSIYNNPTTFSLQQSHGAPDSKPQSIQSPFIPKQFILYGLPFLNHQTPESLPFTYNLPNGPITLLQSGTNSVPLPGQQVNPNLYPIRKHLGQIVNGAQETQIGTKLDKIADQTPSVNPWYYITQSK